MIVNGKATSSLSLTDRSIHYGDGSFTTMSVINGHIQLFNEHLLRLQEANQKLFIEFDNWELFKQSALKYAKNIESGVLKAVITRGSGGRGYGVDGVKGSSFILYHSEKPSHYIDWFKAGITAGLSQHKLAKQPLLAGLKHLNRLEQVLIRREVELSPYDDLLVCDQDGILVEASMANLFWLTKQGWRTPKLDNSGVNGVMRNQVKAFLNQGGSDLKEVSVLPDELRDANEVFVCNSVMGIVSINRLYLSKEEPPMSYEDFETLKLKATMFPNQELCQ